MNRLLESDLLDVLGRLTDWSPLRKARIFMTGGTGLFGLWMLSTLQAADMQFGLDLEITVLSRDPGSFLKENKFLSASPNIKFIQGDIKNFEYGDRHYDYLIHFATTPAKATFEGEDQHRKFETLYFGTKHILDFAVATGIQKILFTSSGVVYGPIDACAQGVMESHLGGPDLRRPDSGLGEGKRIAEYLCAYYQEKYGVSYAIARCFSFIGPYLPLDLHYAIGNFIRNCINQQDIVIKGDGKPVRSYLYMSDAITWLLMMLFSKEKKEIYNVGSSTAINILSLAELVRETLAPNTKIILTQSDHEKLDNFKRNIYLPNTDSIKEKFEVDEWTSLKDGIQKTAAFYSKYL